MHSERIARERGLDGRQTCGACLREVGARSLYILRGCGHVACVECLRARIQRRDVECPECRREMDQADIKELLTRRELDELLEGLVVGLAEAGGSRFVRCPKCGTVIELAVDQGAGEGLRLRCWECTAVFCMRCRAQPFHTGYTCEQFAEVVRGGRCRYCEEVLLAGEDGAHDASGVCSRAACRVLLAASCERVQGCGHRCYGVAREESCPPCLHPECAPLETPRATDFCAVCYVDALACSPVVELDCGHIFHLECMRERLRTRWTEARISFKFLRCPLCDEPAEHPALADLADPMRLLEEEIAKRCLERMRIDRLETHPLIAAPGARFFQDPRAFALERYCFYICSRCKRPFFGGTKECIADDRREVDRDELVCSACSCDSLDNCPLHGAAFLEFKCRFCCNRAIFMCWGSHRFCDSCHSRAGTLIVTPPDEFPPCVCGLDHPPNGTAEYSFGCAMCKAFSN